MELPWHSRLECRSSTPTIPVPHHCIQIHQSGPSLRHSGIQKPPPYPALHSTNGPIFPRRDHTHVHLTKRPRHCMQQSTYSDINSPPGHPTMGPSNNALHKGAAGYHSSTNAYTTTFNTAPNAPSDHCPTPILTSKGGHPEA